MKKRTDFRIKISWPYTMENKSYRTVRKLSLRDLQSPVANSDLNPTIPGGRRPLRVLKLIRTDFPRETVKPTVEILRDLRSPVAFRTCCVVNIRKKELKKRGYSDLINWLEDPNHVYIGRSMTVYVPGAVESKWKNPFAVKRYGREECVELYGNHINSKIESGELDISELVGKTLGCWCHPESCHGDILKNFVEDYLINIG